MWVFLCVIELKCQGNRNFIGVSKRCAYGWCERLVHWTDSELFKKQLKPQLKQKEKPPIPLSIWKIMPFYDILQLYTIFRVVDKSNENTYVILKEFCWSCNMCLIVVLALGLIFRLLIGCIRLSLTFQELAAALEEKSYGGYCLAFELISHPVHFVTVAGTLQLRWGLWGGLHVGMSH